MRLAARRTSAAGDWFVTRPGSTARVTDPVAKRFPLRSSGSMLSLHARPAGIIASAVRNTDRWPSGLTEEFFTR